MTTETDAEKFESAKRLIVAVREANKVDDPKEFWSSLLDLFGFGYLDWLIQQAERVNEIENRSLLNSLKECNEENARLREALKTYADKQFWEKFHDANYGETTLADFDYGNVAITALSGDPDD